MAGRGGMHGGFITGWGLLGSGGPLRGGGRGGPPITLGGPQTDGGKGTQIGVQGHHGGEGIEGQLSHEGGGPHRSPSHGGPPELGPKPGSEEPGMVGHGKAHGCCCCYHVLTYCLNFFCCCYRGPMGLHGRPG